jgi:hypothetical protein
MDRRTDTRWYTNIETNTVVATTMMSDNIGAITLGSDINGVGILGPVMPLDKHLTTL